MSEIIWIIQAVISLALVILFIVMVIDIGKIKKAIIRIEEMGEKAMRHTGIIRSGKCKVCNGKIETDKATGTATNCPLCYSSIEIDF